MTHTSRLLAIVFGTALSVAARGGPPPSGTDSLRLLLSEVRPGSMASEQYCTLVFEDHHFHSEKATRKLGQDRDRKVYEGRLSDNDWNTLSEVLEKKDLRELQVPPTVSPLIVEDAHTFSISIARDSHFQNLEFLNNKSLRPYEPQLKPLLGWWKSLRGARTKPSDAHPDPRCALDSTHAIFAQ